MKPRVVVDTSVLLSVERDALLYLARKGAYTLILSPFLIGEVVRIRTEQAIARGLGRDTYRARINAYVNTLTRLPVWPRWSGYGRSRCIWHHRVPLCAPSDTAG